MTPTFQPTATLCRRSTTLQAVEAHSPLGRLLRRPGVVAFERGYHLDERGAAIPMVDAQLWMQDDAGTLMPITLLEHGDHAPTVAGLDADMAHGVLQAMAYGLGGMVEVANTHMGVAEHGYTGSMRVIFTVDGWILVDGEATINAVNFPEWDDVASDDAADSHELQEATDAVDWDRFGLPVLPEPASAHEALLQQAAAERMVATMLAIHAAQGLPQLGRIAWTVSTHR